MKIAVDAMGGDNAPAEIVKGCIEALDELDVEIVLVGRKEAIGDELKKCNYTGEKIIVVDAREVISNDDKPVSAVRSKKDSSLVKGLELLKENNVDALVSAGNTGAILAGSLLRLGRIKGIDRPAISTVYPNETGFSLLLDAGANSECKPRNLLEFAVMGDVYAKNVLNIENPRIGLANIGIEEGKGTQLQKDAYPLLKSSRLNFIGNAEARDLPKGVADVIVCDGFVGNIILKLTEGVAITMMSMLKKELKSSLVNKIAAAMLKPSLLRFKRSLDYAEFGGAPLLGIDGAVIKAHGSSNATAIKNAIRQAEVFAKNEVIERIKEELSRMGDEINEQ